MNNYLNQKAQSILELVIGLGLIVVVVGAIAIVTTNSLMSTQYSKNQVLATKLAQGYLEKVRTIKNSNYFVCLETDIYPVCSTWDDIWYTNFGTITDGCTTGCTFVVESNKDNCPTNSSGATPLCLKYSASRSSTATGFSGQIIIEDETTNQKRVTSRIYWTDASGEHSSYLVTVLTRI